MNQRKCCLHACVAVFCVGENTWECIGCKKIYIYLNHTVPCRFHSEFYFSLSTASCSLNRKTSPVKIYTILFSHFCMCCAVKVVGCVGEVLSQVDLIFEIFFLLLSSLMKIGWEFFVNFSFKFKLFTKNLQKFKKKTKIQFFFQNLLKIFSFSKLQILKKFQSKTHNSMCSHMRRIAATQDSHGHGCVGVGEFSFLPATTKKDFPFFYFCNKAKKKFIFVFPFLDTLPWNFFFSFDILWLYFLQCHELPKI